MPSNILVNGKKKYKAGIYGQPDFSALSGKAISRGNLALVGDFPALESGAVYDFTDASQIREIYPTDLVLQTLAKVAFKPARDDRVPQGCAKLTVCNITPNVQAVKTFLDGTGAASLKLSSKYWGKKGNQLYYKLAANATDNKGIDVTLALPGLPTETYKNVQFGDLADVYYNGADLSTTLVAFAPTGIVWTWTKVTANLPALAPPANKVVLTPTQMVIDSALTVLLSAAPGAGKTVTVTVKGIVGGVAKTLTLVFAEGQVGPSKVQDGGGDAHFTDITEITVNSDNDAAYAGHATLSATAFDLDSTQLLKFGDMASAINNYNVRGFHCDIVNPKAKAVPSARLDHASATSCLSPIKAHPRADLYALLQTLAASKLVTAEADANAVAPPAMWNNVNATAEGLLIGGTETTATANDWVDALAVLALEDIQITVAYTPGTGLDAATVGLKLIDHCIDAGEFGYERNAYIGAKTGTSTADVKALAAALNSRHLSLCAQDILIETATGAREWQEPTVQAVQLAGIQCGKVRGTSMTHKRPAVFGTQQKWTLVRDDDTMIENGVVIYSKDNLGYLTERVVTTWLEDDNPALSEAFANESVNTVIRRVRSKFQIKIGDSTGGMDAAQLQGMLDTELDQAVKDGDCKAWKDSAVLDLGDAVQFKFLLAPDESLNFILVTPTVTRISSSAG